MNVQTKAFQWSFLLHLLLLGTVVALGSFFNNVPKRLVINFDLEPAPAGVPNASKGEAEKKSPPLRKASPPKNPVISKNIFQSKTIETAIKKQPQSDPQAQLTPLPSEQAAPIFSPSTRTQNVYESSPGTDGLGGGRASITGAGGTSAAGTPRGTGQGAGSGDEKGQNKYLREHFSYIRDKILRNIRYPAMARRMGWEGKVLLSFVVILDGSVKEIKIAQGSGFEILDTNAVETVKETAPFPRPPVEAKLVIPITYRLE
ncbi:MAG TPA: energy transducer TonB [Thermodesulfobacteriota bacterium]|nr:energy transducer TonB [Thermodesulfobacteriota bacterium]